jgi:hypothetical protein
MFSGSGSVTMIVGLFVRVEFSNTVMIVCSSALYIDPFFDNLVVCDNSQSDLVVLQRSIRANLIVFFVFSAIRDLNSALILPLLASLGMAHMVSSMVSFSSWYRLGWFQLIHVDFLIPKYLDRFHKNQL